MRPNVMLQEAPNERTARRSLVLLRQTPFYFMIQNGDWDGFRRRAKSHAAELEVQDEHTGNTLLHEACRRDPPSHVIQTLLSVSRVKNHQGATPLHIAASHRCSADTLKVLLDCASSAAAASESSSSSAATTTTPTNTAAHAPSATAAGANAAASTARSPTADLTSMGRAPIHYACMSFRGLEIDSFLVLLDATLRDGNILVGPDAPDDSTLMEDETELGDDHNGDNGDNGFESELEFEILTTSSNNINNDEDRNDLMGQGEQKRVVNVMSMKDATGKTPLELLFRKYKQRVRTIITKLDRLRSEHGERSILASAITVHAELGELWEKARRIVARLTQERLQREGSEPIPEPQVRSPAEAAIKKEAAHWAFLKHHRRGELPEEDVLPVYVNPSDRENNVSPDLHMNNHQQQQASAKHPSSSCISGKCHKFRIVHASVGLIGYGCPPEMIRLAVAINPHQVREMDEDGNLPLHIAAKASSYLADESTSASHLASAAGFLGGVDAPDDRSVLSDAMSFFSSASVSQTLNPFDKVIKILLQYYPEGARTPQGQTGNLPLVEAVEAGRRSWNDGIRTLLNAYPAALHDKKLIQPHVYPNVLALITSGSPESGQQLDSIADNCDLVRCAVGGSAFDKAAKRRHETAARTTLFELLRAKPEWLTADGQKSS